jgi:hypothetical protein
MKLGKPFRVSGRNAHVLKHGASNINEIRMVAPTGFEPVNEPGHVFASTSDQLRDGNDAEVPRDRNTLQITLRTSLALPRSAG